MRYYYANILARLKEAIKENRRGKMVGAVLLLQDNTYIHLFIRTVSAMILYGSEEINHPPYSSDLVLCHHFPIP